METTQIDQISRDGIRSSDIILSPVKEYTENPVGSSLRDFCPDPYTSDPHISGTAADRDEDSWELMYSRYLLFVQKNVHNHPLSGLEHESLKDWLNRQILNRRHLSDSQFRRLDTLGVIWDQIFSKDHEWEIKFAKLKEFNSRYGHCRVPIGWDTDKSLGLWVMRQRKMYLTGKILEYRKWRLNELGFVWQVKTSYNAQWESFYGQLVSFHAEHGHCNVPGKEAKLVSWIERQRLSKKRKILSAERESMLNKLKFVWEFHHIKRQAWAQKYRRLVAFSKKHGHSFVPINYKENKALGAWVALQRKLEATNKLSKARVKKLDELNFVWSGGTQTRLRKEYDTQWERNFEKLKIYSEAHGTCQVSLKIDPALQSWTVGQRRIFNEGKMATDRIDRLNEIFFPWNINDGYWSKMFGTLTEYYTRFGHTNVPSQWSENQRLAAWVYRTKLNKNRLSPEKISLLDQLGFVWSIASKTRDDWSHMYDRLLDFKTQYGHVRVPVKWPKDPKLGKWTSRMRHERKVMAPERCALLESIGFNWGISERPM
jgi:hypothetical protein